MKFVLVTLLPLISGCSFSQKAGIKKIKSIETKESIVMYDRMGNPTQMTETRFPGRNETYTYKNEYDGRDRLISYEILIDSHPLTKIVRTYQGERLVRTDHYQGTKFGTVHKYILMEYNRNDSLSRRVVLSDKSDTLISISRKFDDNNKLLLEITRNLEYKTVDTKRFSYAENSRTELEYSFNFANKDTTDVNELKLFFDERGQVIKREEWGENGVIMMVDEKEVHVSRDEFRHGIQGHVSECVISYTNDKFNNWTKIVLDYKGATTITNERKITYYE